MLGFFFRDAVGEWATVLDTIEASFVYLASAGLLIAGLSLDDDIYRQRAIGAGQGFALLYVGLTIPIGLVYRPIAAAVAAEQPCRSGEHRSRTMMTSRA
jgi:hypothetical protein